MAVDLDVPIAWFKCGSKFAIVIEGKIFNQTTEFESFFMYFSSFSIYSIQWDSMCNPDGSKKARAFPNRGSLEMIHW